jgi:tetratricopeptide (TPR) repeat protein
MVCGSRRRLRRLKVSAVRYAPAIVFVLGAWSLATAVSADEWHDCTQNAADTVVPSCTAVIKQGGRPPAELSRAHMRRAVGFRLAERWDDALKDLNRALKLDPKSFEALANRAMVLRNKGRVAEALADYDKALVLKPDDGAALILRGQARIQHGDARGGLADLDRAIELDPRDARALTLRGFQFVKQGSTERALWDCNSRRRRRSQLRRSLCLSRASAP